MVPVGWQEADAVVGSGRVEVPQEAFVAALSSDAASDKSKK